jgi:hypothetical protein
MDSPVMWGGIVAVLNYIPYLGPIARRCCCSRRADDLSRSVGGAAAAGDLHLAAPDRGQCHHADDRRHR